MLSRSESAVIDLVSPSAAYHLTSASNGVLFDIDADGHIDRVAWTEAGTQIGFLVLDRNQNGTIDNGSELFGTATVKTNGRHATNGFEALLDLDGGPGISDGQIDRSDAVYERIQVWVDSNHDGLSDSSELVSLIEAGIMTVFTSFRELPRVDRYGNRYRYEGSALVTQGAREHVRKVFDVFPQTLR